ncbi:hypothetical protein HanXRQr2_Chr01g0024421 [Helianthus annuus]|uniref:Uncharacterized protein n=1 Tax=Helianthus annuus TaxID=4232 RepID=A0A9K3JX14_HELAN|nr:hypothetical protein HanXRQr2_Chr01g0024421 [Helianthus annuus]
MIDPHPQLSSYFSSFIPNVERSPPARCTLMRVLLTEYLEP